MKNSSKSKKAATDNEEYEEEVEERDEEVGEDEEEEQEEEEQEEETEDEGEEEEEASDFRSRAKRSMSKKGGKTVKEEKKAGKKAEKVTKMKKAKDANTSSGVSRAEWETPWRPSSVLATAFQMAQKGTTIKDLNVLAKKNNVEPSYVLGAMKREKTRNWTWTVKASDKTLKIINASSSKVKAKKAA